MEKNVIDLPILFLIFNRPETTQAVFDEIKRFRPQRLFIAADGPRNENEKIKTDITRDIVSQIDWDCDVHKLFREKNLGCKAAVSQAISWFFENVEYGAILEDDCLPDQSFFYYCYDLLKKYENDDKVFMISGQKPIPYPFIFNSYLFSKRAYIWGWATWKRSWQKYRLNILEEENILNNLKSTGHIEKILLKKRINDINSGKLNTWDLQLEIIQRKDCSLCIIPKRNLVENIGFNISTHNFNKIDIFFQKRDKKELKMPLRYPKKIKISVFFDFCFLKINILRIILKKIFGDRNKK
ncbi:MAG TPA: hypothetical protein PK771_01055 [Spirochaetota bacterium]|nr:hypothetical protein [Spirochaetota bacterium]